MKHINICVAGHTGTGKTTFGDGMVYKVGLNNRFGKVDEGNSFFDFEEEEITKRISMSLKVASFEYNGVFINFIDTPGNMDFLGDTLSGLSVADNIIVFLDSISGIQFVTEKVINYAKERHIPFSIIINKISKEGSNFWGCYEDAKREIGDGVVPIIIPMGEGNEFKGVVDLLKMKGYRDKEIDLGNFKDNAMESRGKLIESVSETNESLMEKYINEEEIKDNELISAIKDGYKECKIFPVFACEALEGIGIHQIIDYMKEIFVSHDESEFYKKIDKNGTIAFVFKTMVEPHVGTLNLVRVFKGNIASGNTLKNNTTGKEEKINQIFLLRGKEKMDVMELKEGAIGALVKLKETKTLDTLTIPEIDFKIEGILKFPEPSITVAIVPKSKGDEGKVLSSLSKLHDEDPTFSYSYDNETKQTLIHGLGEQHLDNIINKLKRKFGVEVDQERPRIHYRETIKGKAEAQGKYKKQTGGHGQYGDCWLRLEPLKRGGGFEFVDEIVGGVIPSKYIPSVEKGVREACEQGYLAGYPVIDLKVTCFYGSFHPVDSSDIAFKIAASMAFKSAMENAKPVLLEPILQVEVIVPDEFMGDVIGDLNSKRGRILGTERVGKFQKIIAQVPEAEMFKYSNSLRSITQGKGTFTQKFIGYEEVPQEIAQKIIQERKKEQEQQK
uniref:Elongation factor G n=1 Tax=candidate division WOR-3 bacterium TaxID=2052148 RepID=A0A7C4Y5V1_UNCW3